MPTLKDRVEQLTKLKHRLAVWEAIHHMVDEKFIAKDGRKAGAIRVPNCAEELVSEDTIESVLQEIGDGAISDLQSEIEAIENQQVVVLGEAKASA